MEVLGNGRILLLQASQSISGHGTLAAPGSVLLLTLTAVPVDLASTAGHPRRIFRAGWVGSQLSGGVLQVWPVGYDTLWNVGVDEQADEVWWDLADGVTATIQLGRELDMRTAVACRVVTTGTHSIPDSTWTAVTWDSEVSDQWGMVDLGSHPTRLTAVANGWHLLTSIVDFAANATGFRGIRWLLNGGTAGTSIVYQAVAGGVAGTGLNMAEHIYLTVGDYLEVQVIHSAGTSLNIASAASGGLVLLEAAS
jgi:hypothetical protein